MAMSLLLAKQSIPFQDFGERSKALKKMGFPVRFEGEQRLSIPFLDKLKQGIEIDGSLTHRQMGITAAVVVMNVDFPQMVG
jgi:hypothetical protein